MIREYTIIGLTADAEGPARNLWVYRRESDDILDPFKVRLPDEILDLMVEHDVRGPDLVGTKAYIHDGAHELVALEALQYATPWPPERTPSTVTPVMEREGESGRTAALYTVIEGLCDARRAALEHPEVDGYVGFHPGVFDPAPDVASGEPRVGQVVMVIDHPDVARVREFCDFLGPLLRWFFESSNMREV